MSKYKKMKTPEEQYRAQQANRPAPLRPSPPATPVSHEVWRQMTAHQQAAHLARLDGREDEASRWEQREAEATAPQPKKPRRWFR